MINAKQNGVIVKRASVVETLRQIAYDTEVSFDCKSFAPVTSVTSATCRLNKLAGRKEFTTRTEENGTVVKVRRWSP